MCCRGQWGWRYYKLKLGTNKILLKTLHDIAKKSNKGTLRLPNLGSSQFFCLLLQLKVFESITFLKISSWFKHWVQWCSCLRVHVLLWVLLQDISDLIWLSWMVQHTYFKIHEFCFTCLMVEYKRSYIFQSSSNKKIIIIFLFEKLYYYWYLDMNLNSEVYGL